MTYKEWLKGFMNSLETSVNYKDVSKEVKEQLRKAYKISLFFSQKEIVALNNALEDYNIKGKFNKEYSSFLENLRTSVNFAIKI